MKNHLFTIHTIVFIISTIVISTQIALMQYFAYTQWYHFASMIISMCLIGFGVSGILIPKLFILFNNNHLKILELLLVLVSIFLPISIIIDQKIIGSFDSLLIFLDINEAFKFFLVTLNFTIVFTLLAVVLGLIFSSYPQFIGKLYARNLIGSALGGVIVIILFWYFKPHQIVFLNGVIIAFFQFLIFVILKKNYRPLLSFIIFFALLLNISFLINTFELTPSQFKSISKLKQLPGAKVIQYINSPYGRFEKLSSDLLRYSPGLSLNYYEEIPEVNYLLNNGEVLGYEFIDMEPHQTYLTKSTLFLPFVIGDFDKVLLLNPSGETEIFRAINGNCKQITITESNPIIFRIIQSKFLEFRSTEVIFEKLDGRVFLESTNQKFDLIFYPVVEASGMTSGLYAVQEKFLFTKESFRKIYHSLNENGLFSISCYIDNPPRTILKILNLFMSLNDDQDNIISKENFIAINNWNVITVLFKKGKFSEYELKMIRNFCESNQFDLLIAPKISNDDTKYNLIFDEASMRIMNSIIEGERKISENYLFEISAPDDDKPYFSNFIKLKNFKNYIEQLSFQRLTYTEVGYFLLWVVFGFLIILSIALLIFALIKFNVPVNTKFNVLVYFSLIGISFMMIELSLIQRFTLIFSTDIYAITFVICSLLVFSGLGSFFSPRIKNYRSTLPVIFLLIFLITLIFKFLIYPFTQYVNQFNLITKLIFSGAFIFPLAFLLGLPFPSGIRIFSISHKDSVPLAWAVNGSFSVLGSIGTIILLVNLGYDITVTIAALLYLLCGIFLILMK